MDEQRDLLKSKDIKQKELDEIRRDKSKLLSNSSDDLSSVIAQYDHTNSTVIGLDDEYVWW